MREVNKFFTTTFCVSTLLALASFTNVISPTFADSSQLSSINPSEIFSSDFQIYEDQFIRLNATSKTDFLNIANNPNTYKISLDSSSSNVKTGDTVSIFSQSNQFLGSFTISIKGDLDNDGDVDVNDVAKAYQFYKNRTSLDKASEIAGNVTNTESIGLGDIAKIYQYAKGKIGSLD